MDGALRHSVNRTGVELLYLAVPSRARARAKPTSAVTRRARVTCASRPAKTSRPSLASFAPRARMAADPGPKRIMRELAFAAFAGPSSETDDPRLLERLTTGLEVEHVRPGHVLFREGDESVHVAFALERERERACDVLAARLGELVLR